MFAVEAGKAGPFTIRTEDKCIAERERYVPRIDRRTEYVIDSARYVLSDTSNREKGSTLRVWTVAFPEGVARMSVLREAPVLCDQTQAALQTC